MLYHLLYPLSDTYTLFNVFKYITFRSVYSLLTALLLSLLIGPLVIRTMRAFEIGEKIREDGPKSHHKKSGTPTMGGLLILGSLIVSVLLWADLSNRYILLAMFVAIAYGAIGFADDYMKIKKIRKQGMSPREKFFLQFFFASIVAVYIVYFDSGRAGFATKLGIPFLKNYRPDLGLFYLFFIIMVIVGTSNAVNLTDGLDGLAIGPIIIATFALMVVTYVCGHTKFAQYLMIYNIKESGELTVLCGAAIGSCLGFLWFNSYPAQIFMGDVGSVPLGALLGTLAVIVKHELLLFFIGGVFVIEAMSVILQVGYFKMTGGKRIFRMAPLHHHFEEKGWEEPKVIVRFWIVAIILAMFSLSTLKIR
ncbi:MAG: phospho-N-acetylmuramoyl-pentapeptide-transferase [Nitrospinae bacterium]|nr:phospho-N-acetylmuramoyl-pentapeptide-transferase [Nitrospinota bacterium]